MGETTWKTGDTRRDIIINKSSTVYLVQPGGKPPIAEPCYEGYAEFGGVNAFVWLAEQNYPACHSWDEEAKRLLGISMSCGTVLYRPDTGDVYHIGNDYRDLIPGNFIDGNWMTPLPEFGGADANTLVEKRILLKRSFDTFFPIVYPLKFSYRESADYERLEASEDADPMGA